MTQPPRHSGSRTSSRSSVPPKRLEKPRSETLLSGRLHRCREFPRETVEPIAHLLEALRERGARLAVRTSDPEATDDGQRQPGHADESKMRLV